MALFQPVTNTGRQLLLSMRQVMGLLRKCQWQVGITHDLSKPVVYYEEANFMGQPYEVPLFILRTAPCFWLRSGGCSVCNYHLESAMATPVSPDDLRSQIDEVFRNVNGRDLPYILLTTSGSFLDEREISQELRVYALRLMAKAGLRALSFECRAEFLTDCSRLRAISEAFGGTLQAGIGMESSDPFVRNVILHKGLQDKTILKAVSALRTSGIGYYFYVMVGKPFLTLREDLIDTLKTIEQCFLLDASMVVLETVNIQPHTLTKALYDEGFFTPPSLWMAIEVLSNLPLSQRRMIAVKGFEKAAPTPEVLPDTCPNCRDRVRAAIRDWNLFRDWDRLLDRVGSCSCLEAFKQKLSADLDPTHLSKRVESGLSSLKRRLIS